MNNVPDDLLRKLEWLQAELEKYGTTTRETSHDLAGKPFRKFRKKPIVIEAYQTDVEVKIETLDGIMTASPGDWIIRGVNGELYPCKPDIFAETYEAVNEEAAENDKR